MTPIPKMQPDIQHGKPVIPGTRIPVAVVVGSLARGMTYDEVMQDYGVTLDQIRQCLNYATHLVEDEAVMPLSQAG
jgi:uncharacterized protein (DUF433 family)